MILGLYFKRSAIHPAHGYDTACAMHLTLRQIGACVYGRFLATVTACEFRKELCNIAG